MLLLATNSAMASFELKNTTFSIVNEDQSPDLQAGSHPYEMTSSFAFSTRKNLVNESVPDGDPKDLQVELPAGLVGDPSATPKCSAKDFHTQSFLYANEFDAASCPGDTQVGIAKVAIYVFVNPEPAILYFAVYNLVPPPGVPAELGLNPVGLAITLLPTVKPHPAQGDGGYDLIANVNNISQVRPISFSSVTLWGVPSDHSHDKYRGKCLTAAGESVCEEASDVSTRPFLRLPTSCTGGTLSTKFSADSWPRPGIIVQGVPGLTESTSSSALDPGLGGNPATMAGCQKLDFRPNLTVTPQKETADTPSALNVDLKAPQNSNPDGLGESDLKGAVVALPTGLGINPAAADGLAACTPAEIELAGFKEPTCPDASKIGSVEVVSPLLASPLEGSVYQAEQSDNPFKSLLAFYVVVHGEGVTVKLPGKVTADLHTGQLTATVQEAPQLPFSEFKLNFFGGARAPLVTPSACGVYSASTSLMPWSSGFSISPPLLPFKIIGDCVGGFAPSFTSETISNQAGGFSPFSTTFSRGDQDQEFNQVDVHTPPGLLGMVSTVSLCEEPQARLGDCPATSQIGHVTAGAGAGTSPLWIPQSGRPPASVSLTGPYKGAPFGLSIAVPAQAGPFDLGTVVVRAAIYVDPHTAQLTVVSDPLPHIIEGIPLRLRTVNVTIDRADFTFNPTSCAPFSVDATAVSTQGVPASLSSPFQAADCAALPFRPRFTASTYGQTAKKIGASLDVKISSDSGQANISKVVVSLPRQLPSRLTTLQQACPDATFTANPATCPTASNVGSAQAMTPALKEPLAGPVYLVSHGGEAFPDLVIVLQGQSIRLDLSGGTSIKKGVTTSTFATVPDAPITNFELKLPQGPHSALTANLSAQAHGSFCATKLVMPTTIIGQNGAEIRQNTKVVLSGCAPAKEPSPKGRRKS
jgi:hypothetical protein